MLIVPLETDSKFGHSADANSCMYVVHKRPLTELCELLAIFFQIANSCMKRYCRLSQDRGRADFSKNLRLTSEWLPMVISWNFGVRSGTFFMKKYATFWDKRFYK
jgi:hypothetical protein